MAYLINVDFHCHTDSSADSNIHLDNLIEECDRKGIQKIAITDHNRIDGALGAASRWPTRIVPGLEIMTTRGELIAYYLKAPVESGLTPLETIESLKAQGAIISVSHPFDRWRNGGWKESWLLEILPYLDAFEIFNAHCINEKPNLIAKGFALRHQLVGMAGSDAHYIDEVGIAGLRMIDFNDATSLRQSLQSATIFGKRVSLKNRMINRLIRLMPHKQ